MHRKLSGFALAGFLTLASCSGSEAAAPDAAVIEAETVASARAAQTARYPTAEVPERPEFEDIEGEFTQGGWVRGKAPSLAIALTLDGQDVPIGEDGSFFAAFDRDAGSTAKLVADIGSGHTLSEELTVKPRAWQIERINTPRGRGRNLEAYWKKREPEHNAIVAARAKVTGAEGWKQQFIWPVKGRISGRFGRQRIYAGEPASYHSGIDIAPGNDVPFVAPADGVVVLVGKGFSFEGNIVIIDHGAGLNSAMIHASKIVVKEGQSVKQGQHIGNVGATGRATGPHLHWSLKWNDARIDPLLLVGPMD